MSENGLHKIPEKQPAVSDADVKLLEQVLGGDMRAFEELVRRYERRVFRTTMAVTGNQEDAEEAMQDTFLKAYRKLSTFRRDSRFTTWLTRIAVNEGLQRLRRRRETASLDDPENPIEPMMPARCDAWHQDPEKKYARQELREKVEAAIRSLPPAYRTAVVLRDLEGLTSEETAEALGLSLPAAKSRILRARLMLREALAPHFEQRPDLKTRILRAGKILRQALSTHSKGPAGLGRGE